MNGVSERVVLYFIILLCLMPDNFTRQGQSAGVKLTIKLHCILLYSVLIGLINNWDPNWKVWKLHGRDFENLIVNIYKASKLRGGYLRKLIYIIKYKINDLLF